MATRKLTAAEFEQGVPTLLERGESELARLALERASKLRAEGDDSKPRPDGLYTLEELAEAASDFAMAGQYSLAEQARELVAELIERREQNSP